MSEFWGPLGMGCSWCHDEPPLVRGLPFGGALGERCLLRALHPWDFERIVLWLGGQKAAANRWEQRRAAFDAWRRGDSSLVNAYQDKYGADLIGGVQLRAEALDTAT